MTELHLTTSKTALWIHSCAKAAGLPPWPSSVSLSSSSTTKNTALRKMFGCLRRAASNVAQRILQQLLSKLAPPWQHLSSPAPKDKMSSLSALLTWSPCPAKESKGKRKSCPGADSGQTFHTFTGWTRAEKNTSTYGSIKYYHIIIIIVKTILSNSQLKPTYRRCIGFLLSVCDFYFL